MTEIEEVQSFEEMILDGKVLSPYVKSKILSPRDLVSLPLALLERNIENLFAENERYNAQPTNFQKRPTKSDWLVKEWLKYFDEFKKCAERNAFTDAFEIAVKMKIHLETHSLFNVFVGDDELGFALSAVTFKLTSAMFKALEYLENSGQLKLSDLMEDRKMIANA